MLFQQIYVVNENQTPHVVSNQYFIFGGSLPRIISILYTYKYNLIK